MSQPVVLQLKEGVRFPPICARCGAPAQQRLLLQKNFGTEAQPVVYGIRPYFCDPCIELHRREVPVIPLMRQLGYLFGNWYTLPLVLSIPAVFWFMLQMFTGALSQQSRGVVFYGIFVVLFSCVFAWAALNVRAKARPKMMQPFTSITGAVHFTSDFSKTFEPAWRRYTLQNEVYGEELAKVNQDRIWDPHGKEADGAFTIRFYLKILLYVALAAVAVWAIYDDYLREPVHWLMERFGH